MADISRAPLKLHPGIRAASFYSPETIAPSATTGVVTANRIYYVPFRLSRQVIDRISLDVSTGAGSMRLGIYSNLNGLPDQLLAAATESDVSGSPSNVDATLTAVTLPDWCWACAAFSAAPTVSIGTQVSAHILGTDSKSAVRRGLIAVHTYAALPAAAPVGSLALSGTAPCIFLWKS